MDARRGFSAPGSDAGGGGAGRHADVHPGRSRARALRTLSDLSRERLEIISFFVLCLLLCAAVIRGIWNGLRKDFPFLPRLSYLRALGIIAIWGLLFVLILTMIAGARELMTPAPGRRRAFFTSWPRLPSRTRSRRGSRR